ncbi:HNH endonuclease [Haloplanus rallus]|nr:HNH endonuclease [Haloplanus rallus]
MTNESYEVEKDAHAYVVAVEDVGGVIVLRECECPADRFRDDYDCKHKVALATIGGQVVMEAAAAFSEKRLASKFPENDHVRAKIRQTLQRLRDRGEVDFLDENGAYRINDLDLNAELDRESSEADKSRTPDPDSEPQLTEDEERFTETRRRARDSDFIEAVREAYNQTCVVCGSSRETPDGQPEVEAAHIYPKSAGGADDVRNGVALCRLHHWAFDTGWLAFTDDHEILVKDVPEREGYYEFKQLEGNSLVLPEEGGVEPHPTYLQEHRELHGF